MPTFWRIAAWEPGANAVSYAHMRRSFALVVGLAGVAVADDATVWPDHPRFHVDEPALVKAAPGLPALARTNQYYLMRVGDDAVPHCEASAVEPGVSSGRDQPTDGKLVRGVLEVDYHSSGERLDVCGDEVTAREDGDDLDAGGARWFHDEAACKQAIAKRHAVGMDFRSCLPSSATEAQQALTQTKLEAILGHSGSLFRRKDGRCDRIQVIVGAGKTNEGTWVTDNGDDTEEHVAYGYGPSHTYDDGVELTFADAHRVDKPGKKPDPDGIRTGRYACLCVDSAPLTFDAVSARTPGETYFVDRAGCDASFALDTKRAAWLPASR